ncbi:hypothetical protein [Kitasatospora sp. NPDC059673]|uniref:hypothetical protein n=1 Tax=Kitasatospora sp. NPDC059673 TaxID=3346901 RepID=UPI00368FEBA5
MGNSRITRPAALAAPVAAAAILALTSTPALAADELQFDVPSAVSVPAVPDSGDATAYQLIFNSLGTFTGSSARDIVYTYDATGLAGIAAFAPDTESGAKCTSAGQVFTCTYRQYPSQQHPDFSHQFHPVLTGLKGAPQGTAGHLKISQGWVDGPITSTDVAVYAGGPKLEFKTGADQGHKFDGGKPGSTIRQPLELTNNGTLASGRLVIAAQLSPGLKFKQHYANCSYGKPVDTSGTFGLTEAAICTINTSVKPGQTVTVAPMEIAVGADALYPDVEYQALPGEYDSELQYLHRGYTFTPATNSGTRLVTDVPEQEGTKPGPPNVGPYSRSAVILQYRVDSHADLSSWAVWVPTDGGKKGILKVRAHSDGPASVGYLRSGSPVAEFLLTPPSGVTVAGKLPDGCFVRDQHPDVVACNLPEWLAGGEDKVFDVPLAVSAPATGPVVAIALTTAQGGSENRVEPLPYDTNNANNSITLALGTAATTAEPSPPSTGSGGGQSTPPAGSGPTGSASASAGRATPTASGSASSHAATSGDLASTGSEGTGTMLGLGLGAIVVGGGVIAVVARRRRTGAHN